MEAFSDGVFAFAVTLLVLGIRIPRLGDPDASVGLQQLVLQQWPSYVAFALTFIVVGTVWANHRLAFSHFERTDHVLVSLNLLELMSVAFLPVPTGILGTWVVSEPNRFAAVVFYGVTLVVLGIFHNLLWWYGAYRAHLTSSEVTPQKRRALTLTWMAGPGAVRRMYRTGLARSATLTRRVCDPGDCLPAADTARSDAGPARATHSRARGALAHR